MHSFILFNIVRDVLTIICCYVNFTLVQYAIELVWLYSYCYDIDKLLLSCFVSTMKWNGKSLYYFGEYGTWKSPLALNLKQCCCLCIVTLFYHKFVLLSLFCCFYEYCYIVTKLFCYHCAASVIVYCYIVAFRLFCWFSLRFIVNLRKMAFSI